MGIIRRWQGESYRLLKLDVSNWLARKKDYNLQSLLDEPKKKRSFATSLCSMNSESITKISLSTNSFY